MPADLNTALVNLSTQIANKAATATPEELAYLAKAVEGIGGKANVLDIQILSDQRKADITALGDAKKNEIVDLTASKKDEIVTLTGTKKTEISDLAAAKKTDFDTNAATRKADFIATANSADLTTRATSLEGRATATEAKTASFGSDLPSRKLATTSAGLTLVAADMGLVIEVDCAKALDFTTLDLVLPDATTIPAVFLHREIAVKNRSLAKWTVKNGVGTVLATVQPYGWARLVLSAQDAKAGVWRVTPLSLPAVRDRLTNHSGGPAGALAGEFTGPNGHGYTQGYATYGDFAFAVPCMDDTGTRFAGSAMVTRTRDSNWGYSGFFIGPLSYDAGFPGFVGATSNGNNYAWSGGGAQYWNALPVRGGVVTFGINNQNGLHDIGLYRAPAFNSRINVETSLGYNSTYYFATAHTFGDGQFLVMAFANSSGQLTLLRRYRFKSDGSVESAGSITLSTSGSYVAQINDSLMAVHNGTAFGIYDMTAAGTSLAPVSTPASPFPAGMANKCALPVGRDALIASDGAYRWDGTNLTKVAAGYTHNFGMTSWYVIACRDGFSSIMNPCGSGQSVAYFSDAGSLSYRAGDRIVGPGMQTGGYDGRLWPLGGDAVVASYSWCYQTNSSYACGMNTGTTTLTRVAPGNIGVSALGGK